MSDVTTTEPPPPVRYCHSCEAYDDHPRFIHIIDANNAAHDKVFHYDCIPDDVAEHHGVTADHPALQATAAGKRGQDVRDVMAAYAANLPEAPADTTREG